MQLTVQDFGQVGLNPSFGPADAAGDSFSNKGQTYLFVENTGTAAVDVTVDSVRPCDFGFDHDMVVSVAAGATEQLGIFTPRRFNDSAGNVNVTYADATNLNVAVVRA